MQNYMKMLASILLIYVSIINLISIRMKLKQIMLLIVVTLSVLLIILPTLGEFAVIITVMLISIMFLYGESRKPIRSISIPIISVLICIVFDSLISNIAMSMFEINFEILDRNIVLYWKLYIIQVILVFITSRVIGILANKKGESSIYEAKGVYGILIIISLMITLIIFYTNIILGWGNGNYKLTVKINGVLFIVYSGLLIIIMYILVESIKKEMDSKNKQIQLEQIQGYTNNLEKIYTDMRIFRHDYINILSSLIGYIDNKDLIGLEIYFNQNIVPLGKIMESNEFRIGLLKNIQIPALKGILSSKLVRAQELGIDIFIDIVEPIENIDVDIIDICRVIGILLDNAIEAAEKCAKPSLKLAVIKKDNSILIVLINSCENDIPPIYKLYQKGFSTKGENRGLGLNNVKEILNDYANATLDTSVEGNEFKQIFEITNK